jgi:hypothetical protein
MSDPDAMPDPIDKAYVEAEAVLNDAAARSARRARVLAAIASQDAPDAAVPGARPRLWRRGGWLVAACVSALALVVAIQVYRPSAYLPPTKPQAAPAAPAASAGANIRAAKRSPALPAPARVSAPPAPPMPTEASPPPNTAAPRAAKSQTEPALFGAQSAAQSPAPPSAAPSAGDLKPWPSSSAESAPPPPPSADAASEQVQAANQPQPRARATSGSENVTEIVVTGEKRESRRQSVPAAVSAFAGRARDAFDPGARLRTAATAGRTADVETLLARGAPVDAADADGDTPLMKSIQADQPAAAALLRQHGASLDRQNRAGESARDMARDKGDADLDQALGLSP